MVTVYCPEELPLLDGLGNAHSYCPRVRAATKSVLIHTTMDHLTSLLDTDGLLGTSSWLPLRTVVKKKILDSFNTIAHLCQICLGE